MINVPACGASLPGLSCACRDALIYLLPSILLAGVIGALARLHPFFFLLRLAGTISHELAHFVAGLLTGAAPSSFDIIPRRSGNSWQLGAVMLRNVRWYNAAPAALAPMFILLIPVGVAWWRTRNGLHFDIQDAVLAFVLAPQFLSFWPSLADWKIALRSWPYLVAAALVWYALLQFKN